MLPSGLVTLTVAVSTTFALLHQSQFSSPSSVAKASLPYSALLLTSLYWPYLRILARVSAISSGFSSKGFPARHAR
jgi:hypothetical protein